MFWSNYISCQKPTGNWQRCILGGWVFLTKAMFSIGGFWYHAKSRDTAYTMLHGVLFWTVGDLPSKHQSSFQGSLQKKNKIKELEKTSSAFPFSTVPRYQNHENPPSFTVLVRSAFPPFPPSHSLQRRLKIYWLHKIRKPHLPESASYPWDSWSGSKNTRGSTHQKEGGTTMDKPQNMFHVVFSVGHALKLLWFSENVVIGWTNKTKPKLSRLNHQYSEIILEKIFQRACTWRRFWKLEMHPLATTCNHLTLTQLLPPANAFCGLWKMHWRLPKSERVCIRTLWLWMHFTGARKCIEKQKIC